MACQFFVKFEYFKFHWNLFSVSRFIFLRTKGLAVAWTERTKWALRMVRNALKILRQSNIISVLTVALPPQQMQRFSCQIRLFEVGKSISFKHMQVTPPYLHSELVYGISSIICVRPWRWRQYIPPKHHLAFNGLDDSISKRIEFFKEIYVLPREIMPEIY
jgi:hypothetical protein